MSEKEVIALLKSINIKVEALQAQMIMFQEALNPSLEYKNDPRITKESIGVNPTPKIEVQESILMDLKAVLLLTHTEKAVLAVKKGFQKWVALSLIEEPKEYDLGGTYDIILREKNEAEKAAPEDWFHKKSWERFKPQKGGG